MQLRHYQQAAIDATYHHLRTRDDNPCIVVPTGGGKTPIIATICKDAVQRWDGRVLILAHVKELLEQAAATLRAITDGVEVGVYSAGLNSRDTHTPIVVAGIQSVYRRACELGRFDLILIDEAHLLPPDGEGMYQTFLADAKIVNPNVRLIGLTATPYRMTTGMICEPDNLLNHVCYEVGVKELIVQGFLSPLKSKAGKSKVDTSGVHVRGGEFIAGELEGLMDTDALVEAACAEVVELTQDRKHVLIFTAGVKHAHHVQKVLHDKTGEDVRSITGMTGGGDRAETIAAIKGGNLKYLVNVNVLTTGFDAPNIDCVVLLRPTMSPGLYYQMVGRGFRKCEGKADCLVLDFGGNIMRHGPVDALVIESRSGRGGGEAPAKECPECNAVILAGYAICPECGYEFPPPEAADKMTSKASEENILSETIKESLTVQGVQYRLHKKRGADDSAPRTLQAIYQIGMADFVSEWVCPEHGGWARQKFEKWWAMRSKSEPPLTVETCLDHIGLGWVNAPVRITIKSGGKNKWPDIVGYELPELDPADDEPDYKDVDEGALPVHVYSDDDIPF